MVNAQEAEWKKVEETFANDTILGNHYEIFHVTRKFQWFLLLRNCFTVAIWLKLRLQWAYIVIQ